MSPGHVFWFFGLSGAGKTTLATGLAAKLRERGRSMLLLDGDELRAGLCQDLGFSDEARTENIRRAAELAKLAMAQGQVVIAAFITPRESLRRLAGEISDGTSWTSSGWTPRSPFASSVTPRASTSGQRRGISPCSPG